MCHPIALDRILHHIALSFVHDVSAEIQHQMNIERVRTGLSMAEETPLDQEDHDLMEDRCVCF